MSDVDSPPRSPVQDDLDALPHNDEESEHLPTNDSDPENAEDDTTDPNAAATPADNPDADNADDIPDDVSEQLSEIDEDQFEDYNPELANIEDRPIEIDEDVARTLKVSRRQRTDADKAKKPKEGRREKKKRSRDGDDGDAGGADAEVRRPRKARRAAAEGGESAGAARAISPEEDEDAGLTPDERRRKALDRALDAAVKGPTKRRKHKSGEMDLDDPIDDQIATLVVAMERACEADNAAREKSEPAMAKMKLLPQVVAMLNRQAALDHVLDPDSGFLRAVRYFLEPLNDGSLPAYSIQRELFQQLARLHVDKETLLGSGLGKVVFFYTKSKRPEPLIKRIAEKLVGDWSRPILKRTDDYRKRQLETRAFDYQAAKQAQSRSSQQPLSLSQRPATQTQSRAEYDRERALANPNAAVNRARVPEMPASYSVAPQSTFDPRFGGSGHKPVGARGIEAFRRMTQKPRKRN